MTGAGGLTDARVLTSTGRTAGGQRCWSTIGVWGSEQPRCSVLAHALHCRNCDVFKAAGRELLERDLTETDGTEWAEGATARFSDERVELSSVLIFRLGLELMAFPLEAVVEIADWRPVHPLPHRRDAVLIGVANVGGELRLCVSLEQLFGSEKPAQPGPDDQGRLIVIGEGKPEWVVPADETLSVHTVAVEALEPPPATIARSTAAFVRGIFEWRGRDVTLLDAGLVLSALSRRLS